MTRPAMPEGHALMWYDIRTDEFVFIHPTLGHYRLPDQRVVTPEDVVVQGGQRFVPIAKLEKLDAQRILPARCPKCGSHEHNATSQGVKTIEWHRLHLCGKCGETFRTLAVTP